MKLSFFPRSSPKPSGRDLEYVVSLFEKFRRIQKLNTRALGLMAEMERVLGGDFIFDRAFLEEGVRQLGTLTHHIAYCLNAMSGDGYVRLYDRYEEIRGVLNEILCGGLGPFAQSPVLPYHLIGWEMLPLVGTLNVCLAEARNRLDIPAPDGFAVTAAGCHLFAQANLTRAASEGGSLPPALEAAIGEAVQWLCERSGPGALFHVRLSPLEPPGETRPCLDWLMERVSPEEIASACTALLARHLDNRPVALAVHLAEPVEVVGTVRPLAHPDGGAPVVGVTAWPPGKPQEPDSYWLNPLFPFALIQSEIPPKRGPLAAGRGALFTTATGLLRGGALVRPDFLKAVAESVLRFERILGGPQEMVWAKAGGPRPMVLDIRACGAPLSDVAPPVAAEDAPVAPRLLISGGETVQTGVAAGRARHLRETDSPDGVPHGAVLIVPHATPSLYPFLRRAVGIVTEIGSSVGHLATLARELRLPALFGVAGALGAIPDGVEVTLDAGEGAVYRGVVPSVLASAEAAGSGLTPHDAEYVELRRLLRWITPLTVIDPDDAGFAAENCRTYHDIIHYAHERSVAELLSIQAINRSGLPTHARRIRLEVPVDLFVMDLGGGVRDDAGSLLNLSDILSAPLGAFLAGLNTRAAWSTEPAPLTVRDIVTGMGKTAEALAMPGHGGINHAIAADEYTNLGLRLGYHYCIVDSHTGPRPEENHLYFRFAGGFAGDERAALRAGLIHAILREMGFRVEVRHDLVVGNLKMTTRDEILRSLAVIGRLTGFTRQLDMSMTSEAVAGALLSEFKERFLNAPFV